MTTNAQVDFLNDIKDKKVSVTYRNVPTRYDVLTGTASAPVEIRFTFPTTTTGSAAVGEDFLFVPTAGKSVSLSITVGDVTKGLDVLQLQRNYTTIVTATFE
mgnify:CR=1 FL=1